MRVRGLPRLSYWIVLLSVEARKGTSDVIGLNQDVDTLGMDKRSVEPGCSAQMMKINR